MRKSWFYTVRRNTWGGGEMGEGEGKGERKIVHYLNRRVHSFKPGSQEAKAGGLLCVQGSHQDNQRYNMAKILCQAFHPKTKLSRFGSHRAERTAWSFPGTNTRKHLTERVLSSIKHSSFGKTNIIESTFSMFCQVLSCQNSCEWWWYYTCVLPVVELTLNLTLILPGNIPLIFIISYPLSEPSPKLQNQTMSRLRAGNIGMSVRCLHPTDEVSTPHSFTSMAKFDSKQPRLSVSAQATGQSCSHMTGKGRVAAGSHLFKLLGTFSSRSMTHRPQSQLSNFAFPLQIQSWLMGSVLGYLRVSKGKWWRFWLESLGWEWMVMSS